MSSVIRANSSMSADLLNIARPVQGWPVIVQAGGSDAGRQLAAETAEAVFAAQADLNAGKAFYKDVKGRMKKIGRDPDHLKIMPACFVMVGDTVRRGTRQARQTGQPGSPRKPPSPRSPISLGCDASEFDPDGAPAGNTRIERDKVVDGIVQSGSQNARA